MASKCSCRSPVGTRSTHKRLFDVRQRSDTCSVAPPSLRCTVPSTAPCFSRRLGTLCTGGMSPNTRAPWDEGSSPVSVTVSGALGSTQHESLYGFADGSPGRQAASSFPTLFICLLLHPSFRSSKRTRVLLPRYLGDQVTDLPRFPQVESLFQLGVPVDTFRDFSKEQATTVAAQQSPGLVTSHGSFEAFCPSRGMRECHRGGGEALRVAACPAP